MRTLLTIATLLGSLFFFSCKEQTSYPIGKQSGSTFEVNPDISKAKKYLEFVLQHSKFDIAINGFSILQQKDLQTNEDYYVLVGATNSNNGHIAIQLFEDNGQLGITSASLTNGVVYCFSGCNSGCTPQKQNGAWMCSDDCKAECTKTVTKAYEENNYTTPIQAFLEKY